MIFYIKMKKKLKLLTVFFVTLTLFWGLILLSRHYDWAVPIFAIILFPFAILQMTFEHYCLSLNDPHFSLPINDEITSGLLFLLFVTGQTLIYYWLYNKCVDSFKEYRKKK
jgi:hypothetical protein